MAVGEIFSGIGSVIGAGTGIASYINNKKVAQQNLDLQKEHFQYQKDLQNKIFNREDTAYQRMSNDLEKAGFSKWNAVNTGGSSAGAIVGSEAPQKEQVHPDMSGAIQSFSSLGELISTFKQREANVNLSEAQSSLLRQQALTEVSKRLKFDTSSELDKANADSVRHAKAKTDKEIEKMSQDILKSQQDIIESQSRTDLNDITSNSKAYDLLLSSMMSRRTNDPQEKKKLFELARLLGSLVSGGANLPQIIQKGKRY